MADDGSTGLNRILLQNRDRFLRFLAARGARDDAEDVFQDLWHRIGSRPPGPVADPVPYLFRAAENLLRDRRRAATSREQREEAWQTGPGEPAARPSGEQALIARERLREAERVLGQLGSRCERIFRRYRLEGETQAAIARQEGVSLSTVEKELQKAYRALAELQERFDAE
ncbi:RNA polymerase sigma factor [Stakelama saccharophila]|uniref:RNA polymerase sigma factor n=1 Tax=Stakelama saccharophila TaxID=3075605 RepID=A0ABZ0BBC9_9SPHN|nr:RNA polymerase sigma factor [Stakelama sp. W311]WNO54689.1 RNA polymerase sigma factor [Stakelama sp. W311]